VWCELVCVSPSFSLLSSTSHHLTTTSAQKKRARLPWYFYVGSGPDAEKKRSFVRDSSNSGRKLATVMALKRSVQEKGVVEDARGRMWVIDREDPESSLSRSYTKLTNRMNST